MDISGKQYFQLYFNFIREMFHVIMNRYKSVPGRRQPLAMIKREDVSLVNGNTRSFVREKTASFMDGSLIGFAI